MKKIIFVLSLIVIRPICTFHALYYMNPEKSPMDVFLNGTFWDSNIPKIRALPLLVYKYMPQGGPAVYSTFSIVSPYFIAAIPENVIGELAKFYGFTGDVRSQLMVKAQSGDLECSIRFFNTYILPWVAPGVPHNNLFFHNVVRAWLSDFASPTIQRNIQGGLFNIIGLSATTSDRIPFGVSGSINVHFHDGIFYSPDNARFMVDKSAVQIGIVIGALPGTQKALVSFVVFFSNFEASELFDQKMREYSSSGKNDILFFDNDMQNIVSHMKSLETSFGLKKAEISTILEKCMKSAQEHEPSVYNMLEHLAASLQKLKEI